MDPLLIAHPPPAYSPAGPAHDDEMAFDAYCIVCDRLIVQPKAAEPVETKPAAKKKLGGGTIRVKNPDGSTTTRSANGQKVTRPGLRRNPNSAARLVAVNNTAKLQPLARSKTTDATTTATVKTNEPSPRALTPQAPFYSPIYCSKHCMDVDAGRSSEAYKDIARTLSYDFSDGFPLERISTTGLPVSDHAKSPYGPPSPLFISDTESSAASNGADGPACSAPKTMEYFRIHKEGPDSAWNELQRQRRSSIQPFAHRPMVLNSTDSLTSLWNDDAVARSVSGPGKMRPMTPMTGEHPGVGKRTFSGGSDHSSPIPARIPRSNLSHTSLAASPSSQGIPIPPEFGSAPSHTLNLLHSYASAFPVRSPSGISTSHSQRGFVFPGSESDSRRSSISRQQGTIRAKSKSDATWDSFGREAVEAQQQRQRRAEAPADVPMSYPRGRSEYVLPDTTPKQSLERDGGCWKIKYHQPDERRAARSTSRSSGSSASETYHTRHGLAIPRPTQLSTSNSTAHAHSRTPQAMPDIANLRLETGGCGAEAQAQAQPQSVPRTGFSWAESERKGMKTYEIPEVSKFKLDRNKAGLFYFQ